MAQLSNERVTYLNGKIVPESQALVSFRDRSFTYGDAVFDMTRTFGHRVFKLKEHVDRFYNSLRYVRIDGPTACWYGPRTARIPDLAPALYD